MILSNLRDECVDGKRRISMDLAYEDCAEPARTLYFEASGATADRMRARADGFAIACLPLAMWHRESRMRVEAELCTRLREGLRVIRETFLGWYPRCSRVEVEPAKGFAPTRPPSERRTASMLSGGIDGLAALRMNRLDYPLDHPQSIRDCITLFGINNFDVDSRGPVPERLAAFDALLGRLRIVAEAERFELHPVYTNVRSLAPSYTYWTRMGFGAGHIAAAHLFHGYLDKVLYASDGDGGDPGPGAWHPRFVRHFSTDAVQVEPTEILMTRMEKTALVSEWGWGRRMMQPCHYVRIPERGKINCGRCEKCIRTMLALIGLGRLGEVDAFEENDVPVSRLFLVPLSTHRKASLLRQTLPGLARAGRRDLVWAVRVRLALRCILRR